MAELLKYICRAPGCNKKLSTQKRLETHIKSKHPELFSLLSSPDSTDLNFNKNPIENILNSQMTKPKSTILQPIKNKSVTQSNDTIDNIVEKLNVKCNINCLKTEPLFEIQKKNKINLKNKTEINEITDDLIFNGENINNEDYTEIISLDLSNKNINIFQNNKNIPFDYFIRLKKLNLLNNNISNSEDLKYFTNLKILNLNKNKISEISFCEKLIHLEQFSINSNEVTSIEGLYKCNKLKILDISNNKIDNIINTLKTFKKLKSLEELNINKNPFIINLFAYKHYFIYNYQNLLKIDGEEINEIDKDISGRFIRENISMYENLKELNDNNINDSDDMDINDDKDSNIIYKIGNTVISKEMYVPYKSKNKSNNNNNHKDKEKDNKNIINDNNDNNIQEIKKENIQLKEIIEEQKKEIDNLKLELENSNIIIRDYESIITQYKLKYGDINDITESEYNSNNIINFKENKKEKKDKDKEEIKRLKKDLETWKKEYFDLYYKKTNKDRDNIEINTFNNELLEVNTNKDDKINFKNIERPKTAVVRHEHSLKEFENLYKEISIMKSRNIFADVLEEDTDEEEENNGEEKENEDEIKNKSDNNIKDYLNKNKIINDENTKNEDKNNNKILRPLLIKNKMVNDFNIKKK